MPAEQQHESPPRQYDFPPEKDHIVQQGESDVAKSFAGDQVYVSAPGRKLFRHVWLWKSGYTKDTTTKFKPETHGPSVSKQSPLPDDTELQPHDIAWEMLEVGLVFADDPSKFLDECKGQASRRKSSEEARKKRGVMERDDKWFRAYIKVTDYIQDQAKTFVGCLLFDGHLRPITMKIKHIFFYKEFYPDASIKLAKDRPAYVGQAIKFYSAKIKKPQPKPATGVNKTTSMGSQSLAPEVAIASRLERVQIEHTAFEGSNIHAKDSMMPVPLWTLSNAFGALIVLVALTLIFLFSDASN